MYNNVTTTCFGHFLTGHHKVGIQCHRNYISTINLVISASVSTKKVGEGTRSHLQKMGLVFRLVVEIQVLTLSA